MGGVDKQFPPESYADPVWIDKSKRYTSLSLSFNHGLGPDVQKFNNSRQKLHWSDLVFMTIT